MDLDHREDALKLATEGLGNISPPPFLAVVNVYYDGQFPANVTLSDNWEEL